jgi:nitrogenase molybdenum-iron protein beta chain
VFWKGNLREIKRVIERLGVKVNTFFGEGETLDDLRNSGNAALNVVVSDVFGVDAAKAFEASHGIPYISTPFPIGAVATEKFLREASAALGIDARRPTRSSNRKRTCITTTSAYRRHIQRHRPSAVCFVGGDSNYAPALTRVISENWDGCRSSQSPPSSGRRAERNRRVEIRQLPASSDRQFDTDTSSV